MKICFLTEFFHPSYGGQYSAIKFAIDICNLKKN